MEYGDFTLELGFDRDRWEVRAHCAAVSTQSIEVYPDLDHTIFDRITRIGEIVQETGDTRSSPSVSAGRNQSSSSCSSGAWLSTMPCQR
jgi:hypothetical protein